MTLAGHSDTVALSDLIQIYCLASSTCRIAAGTKLGRGYIYVRAGRVTHATYNDLTGKDALFALLASDDIIFHVETETSTSESTIAGTWQSLLLEATHLKDESRLTPPSLPPTLSAHVVAPHAVLPPSRAVSGPVITAAPPRPSSARARVLPPIVVVAAVLLVIATALFLVSRRQAGQPSTDSPGSRGLLEASSVVETVEAAELTGPGETAPNLLEGASPVSPDPTLPVKPTIVCRILVDEQGTVREAKIFRSRLDLEIYEVTATAAVRAWRFSPARKDGRPVRAWLNYPVSFE